MLTEVIRSLMRSVSIAGNLGGGALLLLSACALFAQPAIAQAPATPAASTPSPEVITLLEPGSALESEIGAGNKHTYQVTLAKGQYARVAVEQRGIDVVIRVPGPDGKMIAVVDSELGNQGEEKAEFVAENAGPYLIKLEFASAPATGRYVIQIEELRTATEKDLLAHEARKLDLEASSLNAARKPDEALATAERSLMFHQQTFGANAPETATSLHTLAFISYESQLDFAKAEMLNLRALGIRQKALGPHDPRVVNSLIRLSNLYRAKGDFAAAVNMRERAFEIEEAVIGANNVSIADSLRSLAILYSHNGDTAKAAALLERILAVREGALGPDHEEVGLALRELSTSYSDRWDYEKAESLQRRALAIFEKSKNVNYVTASLNSLGVIYARKGDEANAEQYFQRSLKLEESTGGAETSTAAFYRLNLGNFYRQNKNYSQAEQHLQRALEIWEKRFGPEYRNLPLVLLSQAQLNVETSNLNKAQAQLERALQLRQKALGEDHRDVITVLNKLAWVHALKGEVAEAVSFGVRANRVRAYDIDVNLADTSERQKLAFLGSIPEQLNQALSLHIRYAPTDPAAARAAVTAILQRKGLVQEKMADTLNAMRSRLSGPDRDLFDQWNASTSRLARVVLNGPQRLSLAEHAKRIKTIEEEREKLEAEISRRSNGFFPRTENLTLAGVQAAIPGRAALVEFAVYRPFDPRGSTREVAYGAPRYAAYVLRERGEVGWRDIGPAKEIDLAITSLRSALRDPKRSDVKELARAVDAKVMRPIRPLLGDATQLLLSPDGKLNLIPFEALINDEGRYLIEDHLISYLTSGRDLLRMQVKRESNNKPMVVANPLFGASSADLMASAGGSSRPASSKRGTVTTGRDLSEVFFASLSGTAQEGKAIRKIFDANLLTGAQATESAVKNLSAPRLLHIATHGFFLEDENTTPETKEQKPAISARVKIENPLLRSGLALANANSRNSGNDDGILTALEASGLNLWGTKLVVLSACDTGVGEVRNGEGVYGLRRAFVLAGAESLVMSLWPVSDYTTRELMGNYYKNLKEGIGRGESLRAVQLDMLSRNRQLHPFYWANFIESGEWANLDGKR